MPKKNKNKSSKRKAKTSNSKLTRADSCQNEIEKDTNQDAIHLNKSHPGPCTASTSTQSTGTCLADNPAKVEPSDKTIRWLLFPEGSDEANSGDHEEALTRYKSERRKRYATAARISLSTTSMPPTSINTPRPPVYARLSSNVLVTRMPNIFPSTSSLIGVGRLKPRLVIAA